LKDLFKTDNKWESRSYKVIVLSAIMIGLGLLLGSFVKYTVILASVGSFVLLLGIALYIFSQLKHDKTSKVNINSAGAKAKDSA